MPAVSIIVPFYNAEAHFAPCLRSLFSQSFEDLEFVFVNDGSSDSSQAVLEELAASFPSRKDAVRLLEQDGNQGLPLARQLGLSAASGDYIIFADADDELAPDCCLHLYQEARRTDADMVICGYSDIVDGQERDSFFKPYASQDRDSRVRESIALKSSPFLWNKLVRRALFDRPELVWPAENVAEDWVLSVQLTLYADSVSAVDESLYRYHIYQNSLSHIRADDTARYMARVHSERRNVELVESLFRAKGMYVDYRREFDARKSNVKRLIFPLLAEREMRKQWRTAFPEINWRILANTYTPVEYRIKHLCAMLGVYTPAYSLFKRIFR